MATLISLVLTFLSNALWQVALLGGVAALAARLLRRAPARYRHALWVAALLLSVALPLASLRTFPALRVGTGSPAASAAPAAPLALEPLPASATSEPSTAVAPSFGQPIGSPLPAPPITSRWASLLHARCLPISMPPWAAGLVLGSYLLFVLVRLARLARAWRRTVQIRASAVPRELPPALAALTAQSRRALGLGEVAVLCSPRVAGPQTLGAHRPAILLPARLFESPADGDLAAALGHEMAHVRRCDYALNLFCEFLLLPIAFHPIAVFLKRRIDSTRELACDELATERVLGATAYAHSLVSLARSIAGPPSQPGYSLGVFDANILEERVMRLLDKRPRLGRRSAFFLLGCAALVLTMAGLAACLFSFTARVNAAAQVTQGAGDEPFRPFLGTWRGTAQGKTWLILSLRQQGGHLVGTISIGNMHGDDYGRVLEVIDEPKPEYAQTITTAQVTEATLHFKSQRPGGNVNEFVMKLAGDRAADLKFDAPGVVYPWRIEKESDAPQAGIVGGVPGGVDHGIPGGVVQGVKAGVVGGVVGGVPGQANPKPVGLSGAVPDPGGDPVPHGALSAQLKLEHRVEPVYPPLAKLARIEGNVVLDVRVEADGTVSDIKVESGQPVLVKSALEAVSQWKYAASPELPGTITVTVPFRLPKEEAGGGAGAGAPAQRGTKTLSLSGTVSDPSGARVPDAVLEIDGDAGFRKVAAADDVGVFSFAGLPDGRYELQAIHAGFAPFLQNLVVAEGSVRISGAATAGQTNFGGAGATSPLINIILSPMSSMQSVEVTAKAPPEVMQNRRAIVAKRIRVGGQVQEAKLVVRKAPEYPESARAKGIEGRVLIEAVISMKGEPLSLRVLESPDPALSDAALAALRDWRYQPTLLNGQPIEVVTTIAIDFRLTG